MTEKGLRGVRIPAEIARLQIRRYLRRTESLHRRAWLLDWMEGITAAEIGRRNGASYMAVKRAIEKALLRMRVVDQFAEWFDGDDPHPPASTHPKA